MNDKILIKKLSQLRQSDVNSDSLNRIKSRVYASVGILEAPKQNIFRYLSYVLNPKIASFTFIILISVFSYQTITFNQMVYTSKILDHSISSLNNSSTISDVLSEEKNLEKSQQNLEKLNLAGIEGKYTSQDCHNIYLKYENYIYEYKQKLSDLKSSSITESEKISDISAKISKYEEINDSKWPNLK